MSRYIKKKSDTDSGYRLLADAIILQAVKDYRKAKKAGRAGNGRIRYIKKFFRSEWFGVLTKLDGEIIINKLDAEGK